MAIEKTEGGDVIFLARAPGQVADNTKNATGVSAVRGAASGNNRFDPGSGRFAPKQGAPDPQNPVADVNPVPTQRSGVPQGVTEAQWNRRMDIVRDAAREVGNMDSTQAKDYLKGRVTDLSKVDVGQFVMDVRAQLLDDVTDVLDAQLRGQDQGKPNAQKVVRLAAPRGWLKNMYGTVQDSEMVQIVQRLENRGYSMDVLMRRVVSKVGDPERVKKIKAALGQNVKLSDEDLDWHGIRDAPEGEFPEIELDEEPEPEQEPQAQLSQEEMIVKLAEAFKEMPQPEIHVHVDAGSGSVKRIVHRDANGMIESVEDIRE